LNTKNNTMDIVKIAIVDDHQLVSKALESMISMKENFKVIMNSGNGENFLEELENAEDFPDVVLMDINMPVKNGIETTEILSKTHPAIKVIALTMEDNEKVIIQMLKAGAKGYLLKDMAPEVLFEAVDIVSKEGTFYTDIVDQSLLNVQSLEEEKDNIFKKFRENEIEFMTLACSELTYKEIAEKMFVSPRTVDGYRDSVFTKLGVKTRVGIVLFMMKNNLV